MTPAEREQLIDRFLAAGRRERHVLLKELTPHLEAADVLRIAPVIRDPSPRTCARVVSLMAKHDLEDLLEDLLRGLKPGKIDLLRSHFKRVKGQPE